MSAVAAGLVLFSLRNGVKQTVFHGANQTELNSLTVYPQGGGLLKLVDEKAGVPITDETINQIQAIPGVALIHRQLLYRGLASAEINLLGQTFQTDTLIFGVDEGVVNDAAALTKDEVQWNVPPDQYSTNSKVPVVGSKKLLDFYNLSLAANNGLPFVTESMLAKTSVDILPGFSSLLNQHSPEKPAAIKGEIVGFSNNAELLGITVPIDFVMRLNKNEGVLTQQYSKLRVILTSNDETESVTKAIAALNLKIISARTDDQTGPSLTSLDITLFSLSIIIGILCGLLIASNVWTLFIKRSKEYGIYRCIGASRRQLTWLIVKQLMGLATLGAAGGLLLGTAVIWLLKALLEHSIQLASFPISQLIQPTILLYPLLFLGGICFCLLCSGIPIRRVVQIDPKTAAL